MELPRIVIIGRPNVGKSSLFNVLAGRRISIVEPTSGVTRDRISYPIELGGRWAELVDTGGIGIDDMARLSAQIEEQIFRAIAEADVLLFVTDAQDGITPLDRRVAEIVRKAKAPHILVANKVDDRQHEVLGAEFFALGFGEPMLVSAARNRGIESLRKAVAAALPENKFITEKPKDGLKLAIVGKRNVGKSTLVNALLKDERLIMSVVGQMHYLYKIDRKNVMITGFSGGGFPTYFVGLRHPDVFTVVAARSCNFSVNSVDGWYSTDALRTPVFVYWGENEGGAIADQSKKAVDFLRRVGFAVEDAIIPGSGHDRHPEYAMQFFLSHWNGPKPAMRAP